LIGRARNNADHGLQPASFDGKSNRHAGLAGLRDTFQELVSVSEAAKPAIRRAGAGRVTDVGAPPLSNETKSLLKIAAAGNAVSGAGTSKAANGQDHDWIGGSVWRMPEEDIKRVRSTTSFTTVSYHRGDGEATWRGDRHRLAFAPDAVEWAVVQIEQGPARQKPLTAAGSLTFFPPGVTLRTARPAGRLVQVLWDPSCTPR
jgi:hypothetical protein